jgi:hypothetical protein
MGANSFYRMTTSKAASACGAPIFPTESAATNRITVLALIVQQPYYRFNSFFVSNRPKGFCGVPLGIALAIVERSATLRTTYVIVTR